MRDAQRIILEAVVHSYIQNPHPIGSISLKESAVSNLSGATIRNYLRKLVDEGFLTQIHSSSGRIPTETALKSFWLATIDCGEECAIDKSKIGEAANLYGIYAILRENSTNRLVEVTRSKLGRILASFEYGEAALSQSAAIEKLLVEFTGYDIGDLIAIAQTNRIDALYNALCAIETARSEQFNDEALIGFAARRDIDFRRFYNKSIAINLPSRIYFDMPMMTVAKNVKSGENHALLLAFGAIDYNFLGFINHIKEGE
ncbi:heat-inducible transcription repressor HrcA [Campylobacterota bacterium]|nr:heat-inducible transcription repressor HrcA [Campylobacterota bacterium]